MFTDSSELVGRPLSLCSALFACCLCSSGLVTAADDNLLTWKGLTAYGTIDVGESHQSHGQPQNDYYSAGGYTFPNKASTSPRTLFSQNGLSQSVLGLRGEYEFVKGWTGLFKMESAINPVTLRLTDNHKALTLNNGKSITDQTAATDSSLTGPFSMGFYGGVKSATYGQLTYGRQNTPLKENFYRYDPLGNAAAFSAFGAYGTPAGGGSTENARLNNSLRYQVDLGRVHVDTLYAGPTTAQGGSGWQLGAGSKFDRLSVDGVYTEKKRAVVAAPLGIVGTVPAKSAATSVYWLTHTPPQSNLNAGYEYAAINSVSSNDALAGTVSDNKAWALFAKYDFGGPIVYAGYERITYSDPSSPRSAGFDSIGGYTFAVINNAAYATDKVLETKWIGLKYPVTPKLDLLTAAYRYEQNSYTGNACTVPAATAPGTTVSVNQNNPCSSGTQRSYTMAVDYKLNKYFDLYTGIMASNLSGGLASGFAHTSVYNAMAGIRMKF